jgi:signal transduction histidine kinase/ActR/RegA family two-component response regulator
MMRAIRSRMALAATLPVLLVVLATASVFWQGRVRDLEDSHQQRVDLLARQVALFSAYGLFSGNSASLQSVVQDMQREPGVRAVLVFDVEGRPVAMSGHSGLHNLGDLQSLDYIARQRALQIDVRLERVLPTVLPIEDLFALDEPPHIATGKSLGSAVIEVSRTAVEAGKRDALLTAAWVASVGMLLGGVLAWLLGNWLVKPMLRMSQMIQRIGRGDFSIEAPIAANEPLQELQGSLNQMALRLSWGRDELERQVEEVTQELRLKKEQAETATLAKSRFLAAASHDLRQPSHAMGMFVARMGQLPMDGQMRKLVDHLELSVQALQDLLDGLLDLSRLDAGNVQVRRDDVCVNDLLHAVRSTLQAMAEAKGLRLRIRPSACWVRSDAMLLQRMLLNLVINAIRYTERGTVLVTCRPQSDGNSVRIEVWDSGIGIAPEHHEDIFKEFYQLANQSGTRSFGLGLGLNIVQRSATLLGHQIRLRSAPGCGTRFTIVAEAARPAALQHAADRAPAASVEGELLGMQVLLIEDDQNVRTAVQELLQSWGCVVHVAASLAGALAQVQSLGPPDAILSDYHLGPAEDGIRCIQAVRAHARHTIPACLLSGDTHDEFLQAVTSAGLPLLHKPVRPAKLRSLLRNMRLQNHAGQTESP